MKTTKQIRDFSRGVWSQTILLIDPKLNKSPFQISAKVEGIKLTID